jgi:hypothetical protein
MSNYSTYANGVAVVQRESELGEITTETIIGIVSKYEQDNGNVLLHIVGGGEVLLTQPKERIESIKESD